MTIKSAYQRTSIGPNANAIGSVSVGMKELRHLVERRQTIHCARCGSREGATCLCEPKVACIRALPATRNHPAYKAGGECITCTGWLNGVYVKYILPDLLFAHAQQRATATIGNHCHRRIYSIQDIRSF